jgi:AraC family transcriptional regulator, arabinose operon regulatory protein
MENFDPAWKSSVMKISRDPEVVAGFTFEQPFAGLWGVTHCGEALCSRQHLVPMHTHNGIEVMYLVFGDVTWRVDHKTVKQSAGELCIIGPHIPHGTSPKYPHPRFKALYAGLNLNALGPTGQSLRQCLRDNPMHHLGALPEAEAVLRGIFQRAMATDSADQRVPGKLVELLIALLEERLRTGSDRSGSRRVFSLPIQKAIHYLGLHLYCRVPVSELARVAHLGESHFSVVFRREVGLPPSAYHRQLRLEAAREALGTPDASVAQIACDLGFSSSQHLSALFKSAFGCTLRQYNKAGQDATVLKSMLQR